MSLSKLAFGHLALVAGVTVSLMCLPGCNADPAAAPADGSKQVYTIVCTTGMVTDIVREIAGPRADVVGLLGAGVDPHLYQPTFDDVARLRDADLVFFNGLFLEGPMQSTFDALSRSQPVYAVTEDMERSRLRSPPGYEAHPDPHVWNDVELWMGAVRTVARRLGEFDPMHAAEYEENAARYVARLEELDNYVREVIATIPATQRFLITAHDAFGYFGQRYDIEVKSVQGITTDSEPGVNDINTLVDFLVSTRVPAIFVETSVNQGNIRAVLEGAASKGHRVRIGGELYSDAMGREGTYEGTYIGMIDHNATTIATALGGDAPPGGMHGRLHVGNRE